MTKSVRARGPSLREKVNFHYISTVRASGDLVSSLAPGLPTLETSFENGRAELIRATGAVLIASVLLYFCPQPAKELIFLTYFTSTRGGVDGFARSAK